MYNVKTEQIHMLPPMRCKRWGCTAVVVGNNIVVLGGFGEQGELKSVESFNFERNTWQELPEMSRAKHWHTAVVCEHSQEISTNSVERDDIHNLNNLIDTI